MPINSYVYNSISIIDQDNIMSMREQVTAAAKCREHVKEEMVRLVDILVKEFEGLPEISVGGDWLTWKFHTNGTFQQNEHYDPTLICHCTDHDIEKLVKYWPRILRKLDKQITTEFNEAWKLAMQTNMPISSNAPKLEDFVVRHSIDHYRAPRKIYLALIYIVLLLAGYYFGQCVTGR